MIILAFSHQIAGVQGEGGLRGPPGADGNDGEVGAQGPPGLPVRVRNGKLTNNMLARSRPTPHVYPYISLFFFYLSPPWRNTTGTTGT